MGRWKFHEVLPCPFCGFGAFFCKPTQTAKNVWVVECGNCGGRSAKGCSKGEAVGLWNERSGTAQRWTADLPKAPGFYWAVNNGHWVVMVEKTQGGLVARMPGQDFIYDLGDFEAWAGPISEPHAGKLYDILNRGGLTVDRLHSVRGYPPLYGVWTGSGWGKDSTGRAVFYAERETARREKSGWGFAEVREIPPYMRWWLARGVNMAG